MIISVIYPTWLLKWCKGEQPQTKNYKNKGENK